MFKPHLFNAKALLTLLLLTLGIQTEANNGPFSGINLTSCLNKLENVEGGWCEIKLLGESPSISSVWPKNLDRKTRMITGPSSILIAWNGAAFDKNNEIFYFTGGGHADYGGNEVYQFDLNTGEWKRLTNPSPLNRLFLLTPNNKEGNKKYCWAPDTLTVPASTHSYDGIQFSHKTNTIFLVVHGPANGSCFIDKASKYNNNSEIVLRKDQTKGIYEFNPSLNKINNGLEPLTWRRLESPSFDFTYPRTVELTDGNMLLGGRANLYEFDPVTGKTGSKFLSEPDYGNGVVERHPSGKLLLTSYKTMRLVDLKTKRVSKITMPASHGQSVAINDRGQLTLWNGLNQIFTLDINQPNPNWMLHDWGEFGPQLGDRKVYTKWQYLKRHNVFVGISTHKTGVWVYKHPNNKSGVVFSNTKVQDLINNAKAGSIIKLPPGNYSTGLIINKSLSVDMKDVNLYGIARGRAIVNVNCDNCTVNINNFTSYSRKAGCIYGNCAAIKAEGDNFNLTVNNAQISGSVMGILTDNRGGSLNIQNSTIENTGLDDQSSTLGHGVYAGSIRELIIINSTIRNSNSNGHILKSRAQKTTLKNSKLLGEKGFHSRTIDFPCGGTLFITNSVLQHSPNTDNSDLISVGTEPQHCKTLGPSNVTITNSDIIFDRDHSLDERANNYGPNALFNWRAPIGKIKIENNRIVNLESWYYRSSDKNKIIPSQSKKNTMCKTRNKCDL